ncbi:MAG: hypothetical protein ACE5DI_02775 [Candidatus Micrarchaeia archaeon]
MKKGFLKAITENNSVLLVSKAGSLQHAFHEVLKEVAKKPVIQILLTRPYNVILKELKIENIHKNNIFFVDCCTIFAGEPTVNNDNVFFVKEPDDLTGISIIIEQFLSSIDGEKYLVIDALRLFSIFNDEEILMRFVSSLLKIAAENNTKTIVLTTKEKHRDLINKISPFFESVVESETSANS